MNNTLSPNQSKLLEVMIEEKEHNPNASLISIMSKVNQIFPGFLGFNVHDLSNDDCLAVINQYNQIDKEKDL